MLHRTLRLIPHPALPSLIRMTSTWTPLLHPYPPAPRHPITETFTTPRGPITLPDPYQWLHDPLSPLTTKFVEEQSEYAKRYLEGYRDRDKFGNELRRNWNYPRFSTPSLKEDGNYYYTFNKGLQGQSPIYRFKKASYAESGLQEDGKSPLSEGNESGGELFFDPNQLSTDGSVSRSTSAFSPDGKLFAYALSRSGSDWTTIYVRSTSSPHLPPSPSPSSTLTSKGEDKGRLSDELKHVKFSGIGWTKDSLGFFYQRFPSSSIVETEAGTETDKVVNAMVYYHRIGTGQEEDILVWKDEENPEWMFGAGGTEDGAYITLTLSRDTSKSNLVYIAPSPSSGITPTTVLQWTKVVSSWGSYYEELGNDGSVFYFLTNEGGADLFKVVKFDLDHPELGFTDLIPVSPHSLLTSAHLTASHILLLYSHNVTDSLHLHSLKTGEKVREIRFGVGAVDSLGGRRGDGEVWVGVTGFGSPGEVFRYRFGEGEGEGKEAGEGKEKEGGEGVLTKWRETKVEGLKSDEFVTEQVWFVSKDGTRVPMFVVRPVGVEFDGTAPGILYGYGGFSVSIEPFFSPSVLTWIKHYRGIFIVANIRGGAEFGESWHLAGTKERKQNVFDDFQYAAKYLHEHKYVARDKLAISGGSNGGLLVAACVNQAPELFGAAIADVGVMDMLRYQRFTIGRAWASDYGNADEEPVAFDYLNAYSPLQNVDPTKTYPPTMLLTADHDDRVVPLHSFKLAAELQYQLANNPHPLLLRVDTKSGHGAGKSTEKKIEEAVDKYGFVSQSMGLEWFD